MTYNFFPYSNCMPHHCMPDPCHHNSGSQIVVNCTPCCPKEEKKPVDLSKLSVQVNPVTGEIEDAATGESTGQKMKDCVDIIQKAKDNDLEIGPDGKLTGGCGQSNKECEDCVAAINKSIVGKSKEGEGKLPDKSGGEKGDKKAGEKGGQEKGGQEKGGQEKEGKYYSYDDDHGYHGYSAYDNDHTYYGM